MMFRSYVSLTGGFTQAERPLRPSCHALCMPIVAQLVESSLQELLLLT